MHQVSYQCLLSLKYFFFPTTKPVCLFSDQTDGLTWLVVAISRVKRCPQRLHPQITRASVPSLWILGAKLLVWYPPTSDGFVPKEAQSARLLLLLCLWVNLSAKCEHTEAGKSILISGFVIFSSFIILHCKLF